jgi:hypothetical protein
MFFYRSPACSFRDLRVWQKAHEFVLAVCSYSESVPDREKYGLAQLRLRPFPFLTILPNASASVALLTRPGFLNTAEGSVEECRYDLSLPQELGYGQSQSLTSTLEKPASCSTRISGRSWLLAPNLPASISGKDINGEASGL